MSKKSLEIISTNTCVTPLESNTESKKTFLLTRIRFYSRVV
jgi:hypothetical protein